MVVFGFSRRKTWNPLSWLIMLFDGTGYSHSYVRIWSESMHRWLIYQASMKGGLHFCSLERFLKDNIIVDEFSVRETDQERLRLVIKCVDYAADDYSVLQLVGIGLVKVMKWFKFEVKNPWPFGWICTEIVYEFLDDLGIKIDQDRNSVGLKTIRDHLKEAVINFKQQGRWSFYKDEFNANKDR